MGPRAVLGQARKVTVHQEGKGRTALSGVSQLRGNRVPPTTVAFCSAAARVRIQHPDDHRSVSLQSELHEQAPAISPRARRLTTRRPRAQCNEADARVGPRRGRQRVVLRAARPQAGRVVPQFGPLKDPGPGLGSRPLGGTNAHLLETRKADPQPTELVQEFEEPQLLGEREALTKTELAVEIVLKEQSTVVQKHPNR